MCSTPKSDRAVKSPKAPIKGFLQEVDANQRALLAEKSNEAEEHRQQRLSRQRRQRQRQQEQEEENYDGFWATLWQWLH